jgi:3-hydroxybutyryl-CoA dehydrogenase
MEAVMIRRVAVIGAGTMGHAIALVHAQAGIDVRLHDTDPQALERAGGLIDGALATLAEAGELEAAEAPAIKGRIERTGDLARAVRGADLVIEAVVEDAEVKREVFARIHRHAPEAAPLASNTSYLDVFPLMPEGRPALITHWYTPPYIIDLVDLVPGPGCGEALLDAVRQLLLALGKHPVVFRRFIPGYVANRLQAAITQEVLTLLDEGIVGVAEIDDSIRHGLALRMALMGHLKKSDHAGLELVRRALASGAYVPPPHRRRSRTLDELVARGRTGVLAGAGFYDYGGRAPEQLVRERDRKLLALKREIARIGEV